MTLLTKKKAVAAQSAAAPERSKWFAQIRWNHQNREARRAHGLVADALRAGTLKRGKCKVCNSLRVEAHHPDYSKPLEVEWLCRKHHRAIHAEQRRQAKKAEAQATSAAVAA